MSHRLTGDGHLSLRRFRSEAGITRREIILLATMALFMSLALVPLFKSEEKQASNVAAMNNLVQWGIGLNLYLLEHDNRLPKVGPINPSADLSDAWYNALPPYLSQAPWSKLAQSGIPEKDNSAIIWRDPVMLKKFGRLKGVFIFPYAMNRWLQPDLNQSAYQVYDLQNPGSVVFLGESSSTDPGLLPAAVSYRHTRKPEAPTAKAHVLFVDGHAAPVERQVLSKEPEEAAATPDGRLPSVSWVPFAGAPTPVAE